MKKFHTLVLMMIISSSLSISAQNTWTPQISTTSTHLYSIYFADRYNGWVVGENGLVLHTTNSGNTWTAQTSNTTAILNSVCFATKYKGWAAGNSGKIIYTSNGGTTWASQTSNTVNNLMGISFVDTLNGWAVGVNGTLLHTSNGGLNWNIQSSAVYPSSNAVKFVSKTKGWAVGNMGRIIYTSDSGTNWITQTSGTTLNLLSVSFPDPNHGWAVGINGTVLHTSNSGSTWTAKNSGITDALLGVYFADTLNGWAVGVNGKIISTTNGGNNWSAQNSGITSNLRCVFFYKDSPGWIVGNDGKIFYTKKSEEICLVTVDTNTNHYKIVWEKYRGQGTAYYNVYKEQGTSNYVLIGTVPFSSPAQYTDLTSKPDNNSEQYKISSVDSMNIESSKSPYHKPMFLQTSQGVPATNVNLDWNFYVDESGGFVPSWYYIYRGHKNGKLKLQKIDSVSGSNNKYTDVNVSSTYYYRVGFKKDNPCDVINTRASVSTGPYSQSVSNLKDYGLVGEDYLQAYPDDIIISKESQLINFTVFTNLSSWNAVSSELWLYLTNNISTHNINTMIAENTGNYGRNAIITVSAAGRPDKIIYITQYGLLTSIKNDLPDEEITIYQSPYSPNLNIVISNSRLNYYNLEIFDINGRIVKSASLKNFGLFSIPIDGLTKGIYLVKLSGDKIITKKVFICP
jgi:photosystem II stability/assembly factor-like uncharacterized protein